MNLMKCVEKVSRLLNKRLFQVFIVALWYQLEEAEARHQVYAVNMDIVLIKQELDTNANVSPDSPENIVTRVS